MKQKEWKTAHIKVSFSLSHPGCNTSPSVRANAAAQSSLSMLAVWDGERVTVSPALNLPGGGGCTALQHQTQQNGTQNTEKKSQMPVKKDLTAMKAVQVLSARLCHTLFWKGSGMRQGNLCCWKVWVQEYRPCRGFYWGFAIFYRTFQNLVGVFSPIQHPSHHWISKHMKKATTSLCFPPSSTTVKTANLALIRKRNVVNS